MSEHKTADSRGPAVLALSPEIYLMVKHFIEMCRRVPEFNVDENRSIFTCWPKADNAIVPMTSSHINRAINRLWAMGPISKPISATKIRKATTTHVREAIPGARDQLAKHMSHDPKTADKYYNVFSSAKLATPTCQIIANIMEEQPPKMINKSIHWIKDDSDDSDEDTLSYDWSDEEVLGGPPPTTEDLSVYEVEAVQTEQEDDKEQEKEDMAVPEEEQTSKPHGRRAFSNEESTALIRLCGDVLNSGEVNRPSIQKALRSSEEGRHSSNRLQTKFEGSDHWKKIVDRVHVARKTRHRKLPTDK